MSAAEREAEREIEMRHVYRERAQLVALLAALWPSVLCKNDPAYPDWWVLYVLSPTGQLSWHIAEDDVDLFCHVGRVQAGDSRAVWDGHTNDEKYERLAALVLSKARRAW